MRVREQERETQWKNIQRNEHMKERKEKGEEKEKGRKDKRKGKRDRAFCPGMLSVPKK